MRQTRLVRDWLRGLIGDQLARSVPPDATSELDVRHRVLVQATPEQVWRVLHAAPTELDLASGCVRVLRLPDSPGRPPQLVGVWRRSNGRLRAGLSEVLEAEPTRVVTRSVDGASPLLLTTATEPLDAGCVVTQRLEGLAPGFAADRLRRLAGHWLERGLLQLKAHVEGVPVSGADPGPSQAGIDELEAGPDPGVVPVSATATTEVGVPADRLWEFLDAALVEPLISPRVPHVLRTTLEDDDREHVVSVHRHDDGRRSVHVTQLVETSRPTRIVERSLTADLETDVVVSISPERDHSILTETFTGWLPQGAGVAGGAGPIEAQLRARLETIRRLAEAAIAPQRDPRPGFLPPGAPTTLPPELPGPTPPAVLLPPPHLVVPAPVFDRRGLPGGLDASVLALPPFGDAGL